MPRLTEENVRHIIDSIAFNTKKTEEHERRIASLEVETAVIKAKIFIYSALFGALGSAAIGLVGALALKLLR